MCYCWQGGGFRGRGVSFAVSGELVQAGLRAWPVLWLNGDSISLGYTPYVIKMMKGKASVRHHEGNAGPTIRGIDKIDQWLGNTKWDVIHFNWGLHDMYGWVYAKDDRSPAMYEKRLETLVTRLKKTNAKLVWATTTPACPKPEHTMLKSFNTTVLITEEQERRYLDRARKVMQKHGIPINDLHARLKPEMAKYALAENDVHYTEEGYEFLGGKVAEASPFED